MNTSFDDAVVGAGILGLAHAYHLACRGRRVIVFERGRRAAGASVRNFGMIWPIGQPAGPARRLALRSRDLWLQVLEAAGLWFERQGSLHLAYHEDEARVLREFREQSDRHQFFCQLLDADQVVRRAPLVRRDGLRLGLWSPNELCVDPREVIARLPGWLSERYGVTFAFDQAVLGYERPVVRTSNGSVRARRLFVCSGDEFQILYPEVFQRAGLTRCKLQMLRTEPLENGQRLGPMIAGGLTLRHYASFADCPTLPRLVARVAEERPEFDRFGIHVMAAQNGRGEIVIGDSHEYDDAIEPFDKAEIEALILEYLHGLLDTPRLGIAARWHGSYAKSANGLHAAIRPEPGALVITGVGGAGMTLSFGLAEHIVQHADEDMN